MDGDKKARFLKVYSDLPINIRREVIAIINEDEIGKKIIEIELAYIRVLKQGIVA